jgi:hypothetical protein
MTFNILKVKKKMQAFTVIKHKATAIVLSDMSNTNPQEAMQAAAELLKNSPRFPKKAHYS